MSVAVTHVPVPAVKLWDGIGRAHDFALFAYDWCSQHLILTGLGAVSVIGFLVAAWQLPIVTVLLLALLVYLDLRVWWGLHQRAVADGTALSWRTPRKQLAGPLFAPLLLGVALAVGVPSILTALGTLTLIVLVVLANLPDPEPEQWWSHGPLTDHLFHPTVLKFSGDDQPSVSYLGQPRTDENGTTVKLQLPGISWEVLAARHSALAARLHVSRRFLTITNEGDPEDVVTIWKGTGKPAPLPNVTLPDMTRWADGVKFAYDSVNKPLTLVTRGVHTLFVGMTGSGKTWAARWFVKDAVLDPTTDIDCIDGKDNVEDWRPMKPLCGTYVGGSGKASVVAAVALLERIEEERERRKDVPASELTDYVLVVDEWAKIVSAAKRIDANLHKQAVALMGELAATARSARIHLVFCVQRGTTGYLPNDLQANLPQRVVGRTVDADETRYALDGAPATLPSADGEFLVQDDGRMPVLARVPEFTNDMWHEVCRRGLAMRQARRVAGASEVVTEPVVLVKHAAPVASAEGAMVDEVALILADGALTPTELWNRLPARLQPKDPGSMSRQLGKHDQFRARHTGRERLWMLVRPDGSEVSHRGVSDTSARSDRGSEADLSALSGAAVRDAVSEIVGRR